MNKNEVKQILMSMRNARNERQVNNLLGKIDMLDDTKLQEIIAQIGDNEEKIRSYLEQKINEEQNNGLSQHEPINAMFSYGITGNTIHLHMPFDLSKMIKEKGRATLPTVFLHLIDAIERIRNLQNEGFYKFKGKDTMYMISPILVGKQPMQILEALSFETERFSMNDLQNIGSLERKKRPEARLAKKIFGENRHVARAKISMKTLNSKEWQEKRNTIVEELEKNGGTLEIQTTREDL